MRKREEEPLNAQKKRRKLRPADVAALLVLLIVVVLAALSLEDYVYGRMLKFTAVQSGVLEEKIYAQAIVMRQEYLLTAPIAGTFHPSMGEGDRANVNAVVGYVYGATSVLGVTTSRAGIVSFAVDGLETLLYPYISLADIDVKMVFELAAQEPPERGGEEGVVQGGVVGKIIDNLASHYWMILYFPGRTDIEAVNSNLSFFLANGKALSGRVDGSSYLDDGRFFYVRISMTRDDILLQRVLNAYVIGEKYSGVIIPKSALLEKEGVGTGVYVREKSLVVFKPVQVLGVIGEEAAVSGINPGTDVVVNPAYARDGRKAY